MEVRAARPHGRAASVMSLLPALGLPALGPVLSHPLGYGLPPRRGHAPFAAPACADRCLGLCASTAAAPPTGTTDNIRELGTNRVFFSTKLLEARHRAKACQTPELLLIQVCHTSSS
jgi:hypothetical protein